MVNYSTLFWNDQKSTCPIKDSINGILFLRFVKMQKLSPYKPLKYEFTNKIFHLKKINLLPNYGWSDTPIVWGL